MMKIVRLLGFVALLAAIAGCFYFLSHEPEPYTNALIHYGVRVAIVVLCLGGWFWTQALIGGRAVASDGTVYDGIHAWTAPVHAWFAERTKLSNAVLIVSSGFIDAFGIFIILRSILGPSMAPFGALLILFMMRQVCQGVCGLPIPKGMIWRNPGFPSLLVTYGTSNDFFFSGHTAIAVLGAYELALISPWLGLAGGIIALLEATVVVVFRAHYTIDVIGAILATGCAVWLAAWLRAWALCG